MGIHQNVATLAVVALLGAPGAVWAQSDKQIAVLGLEITSAGSDDNKTTAVATGMTQALRTEVREAPGYVVAKDSEQDLVEAKLLSGCEDEAPVCMANIGTEFGADMLLYGRLSKASSGYQVETIYFDVAQRKIVKTATTKVSPADAKGKKFKPHAKSLFAKLTGQAVAVPVKPDPPPIAPRSKLAIKVATPRLTGMKGSVFIDGVVAGSLTDGALALTTIPPGTHVVRLALPGYEPMEKTVVLRDRVATELTFDLVKPPDKRPLVAGPVVETKHAGSDTDRTVFWTAGAVTAVAGGLWLFSGLKVLEAEDETAESASRSMTYNQVAARTPGMQPPTNCAVAKHAVTSENTTDTHLISAHGSCNDGLRFEKIANISIAVTAVAGAITAFYAYRAFFRNPKKKEAQAPGPSVQFQPILTPTQAGAGMTIRF